MAAEKFFDFVILKIQLYTGAKITVKIIPTIIDSKIGFNMRKAKTARTESITVRITLFKYSSSILIIGELNL